MTDLRQAAARAAESAMFPAGCADLSLRSPEQLSADVADAVLAAVSGAIGEDVVEAAARAATSVYQTDQWRDEEAARIADRYAASLSISDWECLVHDIRTALRAARRGAVEQCRSHLMAFAKNMGDTGDQTPELFVFVADSLRHLLPTPPQPDPVAAAREVPCTHEKPCNTCQMDRSLGW